MSHPVLYSLQNCPYAMRARMAILLAKQPVWLRAIKLNNKPAEMLAASPKATVPVLVINDKHVVDESLDIMLWALNLSDPDNLLFADQSVKAERLNKPDQLSDMLKLIQRFDAEFKTHLENYKCAKRYHEDSKTEHRQQCEVFIAELENRLNQQAYLFDHKPRLADYAILPYIRQFARVDRKWYSQAPYPKLQCWLKTQLTSSLFSKTMKDYPLWLDSQESFLMGID